jgi:hypothetical protein
MKEVISLKSKTNSGKQFLFNAILERWASGMEYYAISIPHEITVALKTNASVPVLAQINNSEPFMASLFPVGGGRHYLRIKNIICKAVKIKEKDTLSVKIIVRNREEEITIPSDLRKALKEAGVSKEFDTIPVGRKSYILRIINEAARAETREKRINEIVKETVEKKKK